MFRRSIVTLATLTLLALGPLPLAADGATGSGSPPRVGDDVRTNDAQLPFPDDFPSRNDATLASSQSGQHLLVGWEDLQGVCGPPRGFACEPPHPPGLSGFAFSTDGGQTWTDGGAPFVVDGAAPAGHPWADRGGLDNETFFFTSRVWDEVTGGPRGVSVHRGHFGAGTFVFEDATILNSDNPRDFYSRQAIAAAKGGSGDAYVSLSNIIETCEQPFFGFGQIEAWRTHDGGDTWQGPVVVSPDATFVLDPDDPLCGQTGVLQIASSPAPGPDGEVYVVWQFGPTFTVNGVTSDSQVRFARSLDGGATFSEPQPVAQLNSMRHNPLVGYGKNRFNDHPRIAVAAQGPHRGRIYVTYHEAVAPVPPSSIRTQSLVSSQAFLIYSDDRGDTWSAPVPLGPPLPSTGVKRVWPTVDVQPSGAVDVVFLESQERQATPDPTDVECEIRIGGGNRRTGPVSSLVDTYWVRSTDGGDTFSEPFRLSSQTSNWCAAEYRFGGFLFSNFGDYIDATATADRVQAVWSDAREGQADVFFAHAQADGE